MSTDTGQPKPHTYQRSSGDGDTNEACFCDRGYSHSTSPSWLASEERAVLEVQRIHEQPRSTPMSEADRKILIAEVKRVRAADKHIDRLLELLGETEGQTTALNVRLELADDAVCDLHADAGTYARPERLDALRAHLDDIIGMLRPLHSTEAVDTEWSTRNGQALHLPSHQAGLQDAAAATDKQRKYFEYRLAFGTTGVPCITGAAQTLSRQLADGLEVAPAIWSLATLEQRTMSQTYDPWTPATCIPDDYRHLGPMVRVPPFSDVEECQSCHTQIGK